MNARGRDTVTTYPRRRRVTVAVFDIFILSSVVT